ncbi:MAG: hypothetical protein ABI790_18870 [Betaproteobacteria bacterium]
MKDTILNSILITAAFSAILSAAIGNLQSSSKTVVATAPRVVEMGKTVVAAKRLPVDTVVLASAAQ